MMLSPLRNCTRNYTSYIYGEEAIFSNTTLCMKLANKLEIYSRIFSQIPSIATNQRGIMQDCTGQRP